MSDKLIPVAEARTRLLFYADRLGGETVPITEAGGRVLVQDLKALRTQPPQPVSAMDGYAVRNNDIKKVPVNLLVVGQSAAGHPFSGSVGPGEAVRIFTGAVVPNGADTVTVQENVFAVGDNLVRANKSDPLGRNIRAAGLDFTNGETVLKAGTVLDAGALCLAAAANHPTVRVVRRPSVAILATGDELLLPGSTPGPGQIIASNTFGVAMIASEAGATVVDLGIVPDREKELAEALDKAKQIGCDVLVTLGGASVGDHDLVQRVFVGKGMTLGFWKIAMRPGKPLMSGRYDGLRILGLPGNPVSALVCAHLFLGPLIEKLGGRKSALRRETALLDAPIHANDSREDYMRGRARRDNSGRLHVSAFELQDSSMISTFAQSDVLIVRPPKAPAAAVGDPVEVILLKSPYI
ncbi:MAG: gephyrin-like molybdotransferase Glp [Oricola sp.]